MHTPRSRWWFPAVIALLCTATFRFDADRISWLWAREPAVTTAFIAVVVACAVLALRASPRRPAA